MVRIREDMLLAAPRGTGRFAASACPVCGEPWLPPPQSRLLCHARCLMDEEDQDRVLAAVEVDPRCTAKRVGDALGVTPSIINANLRAARLRRAKRRRAPTDPLRPRRQP